MRINYDCIRDVLLALEDIIELDEKNDLDSSEIIISDLQKVLPDYSIQDITYSLVMLKEADYIHTCDDGTSNINIVVNGITFEGHKYLDTIRTPAVWEETKKTFREKAIDMTMEGIILVANSIIKSHLIP